MSKRILVYDFDGARIELINQQLGPLDWEVIITDKPVDVNGNFDYAFVSLNLPHLHSLENTRLITIIDPKKKLDTSIYKYSSILLLTAPVASSEIVRSIEHFSDNDDYISRYLGRVIDIRLFTKFLGTQIKQEKISLISLDSALEHYCLHECENSYKLVSSSQKEMKNDNILDISNSGTIKSCDIKNECNLRNFKNYLKEVCNTKDHNCYLPENPLEATMKEFLLGINKFLEDIHTLRKNYCIERCDKSHKDLNFKKGDIFLVDLKDMLQGNCVYCNSLDCRHYKFFHYFSNHNS